jgi:predicted amidohydrolase YtcJ
MQPRRCAPEIVAGWRANVGPQRWRHAWAFRSLRDAGAQLAFSSDWNVAEMDPLIGIYTALTRADLDRGAAWVPEETVDLDTALRAYTHGGARTIFAERERGVLREGAVADLALLSQDPFALEGGNWAAFDESHARNYANRDRYNLDQRDGPRGILGNE